MTKKQFPKDDVLELMNGWSGGEQYNVLELSEWEGGGKYQSRSVVFEEKALPGIYWTIGDTRSGSYYSDYWHESESWNALVDCQQVRKVEKAVIIIEWELI